MRTKGQAMMQPLVKYLGMFVWFVLGCLSVGGQAEGPVTFDSGRWRMAPGSRVEEFLGRQALTGSAWLEDVQFGNGVIEVDLACTEGQVFPGIVFRAADTANYEEFYLRPHQSGQPTALQYSPVHSTLSAWQLYYGEGYTASWVIPKNQWLHLKMEISGTQARVYIGETIRPALVINDLKRGSAKGFLGLKVTGPAGLSYFSDFKDRHDDGLRFEAPPGIGTPLGTITSWELSPPLKFSQIDVKRYPGTKMLGSLTWQRVTTEPSGVVNIGRYLKKSPTVPDTALARTRLTAATPTTIPLEFGYSDIVSVFLNGQPVFYGRNAFQSRDPFFQGSVGLFDTVFLPLRKGDNELLLILTEQMGGWGFMCRDASVVHVASGVTKLWQIAHKISYPETVVYDSIRDVLYVSGLYTDGTQFVSRIKPTGEIDDAEWLKGLNQPTGMAIRGDTLFVVERAALAEVDIRSREIKRHPFPAPAGFPNDVAIDEQGSVYVTESQGGRILKLTDGRFSVWKTGPEYAQVNGIHCDRGRLYVGFGSDATVRTIDLATGEVKTIATLDPGAVVDGIEIDPRGNLYVSDFRGKVYRIAPDGLKTLLLDVTGPKEYCANFAYVPGRDLLVIPTLVDNRIVAYRLPQSSRGRALPPAEASPRAAERRRKGLCHEGG